jgi:hypothetical protein
LPWASVSTDWLTVVDVEAGLAGAGFAVTRLAVAGATVTSAPGITEPVRSWTVPLMANAAGACAKMCGQAEQMRKRAVNTRPFNL